MLSFFVFKSIRKIENNAGVLFLLILPPLFLLVSHYFEINYILVNAFLIFFIASITFYPFVFKIKKLKDASLKLLIYLTLLIEWDWIITWTYLNKFSLEELNPLLNIDSLFFFSIQKLLPLTIFFALYLVSRNNKKLSLILEVILAVVCIAYALLYVWQLYVVALFTNYVMYILPISGLFILFYIYKILRTKFNFKKISF